MKAPLGLWRPGEDESPEQFLRRVAADLGVATGPPCSHSRRGAPVPGTMRFGSIPCEHPAVVKILYSHGGGDGPVYHERCIGHTRSHLSPMVAATWDPTRGRWAERGFDPIGWWR